MDKKKKIAADIIYTIGALLLMNGVIQLFIYPLLNKQYGSVYFGNIIYYMGFVGILSPAFGSAINNSRLVERNKYYVGNGVCNIMLLCYGVLTFIVCFSVYYYDTSSMFKSAMLGGLGLVTMIRYYADVEYRLSLKFKNYFIFYLVLSLFYVAGVWLSKISKNWIFTFLVGEVAALLYLSKSNTIFINFWKDLRNKKFFRAASILAASYLVYNLILNVDRLIIQHFLGSLYVTQYYVVSLIGKSIAILVASLNGLIISYLTKDNIQLSKVQFSKIVLGIILTGIVFYIFCILIIPVFLKICYPGLLEAVTPLISLVSISQIFCFISSILLIVVLTLCKSVWQLYVQLLYGLIFISAGIFSARTGVLYNFVIATLFANIFRFVIIVLLGLKFSK